jgi:hypothetical protein
MKRNNIKSRTVDFLKTNNINKKRYLKPFNDPFLSDLNMLKKDKIIADRIKELKKDLCPKMINLINKPIREEVDLKCLSQMCVKLEIPEECFDIDILLQFLLDRAWNTINNYFIIACNVTKYLKNKFMNKDEYKLFKKLRSKIYNYFVSSKKKVKNQKPKPTILFNQDELKPEVKINKKNNNVVQNDTKKNKDTQNTNKTKKKSVIPICNKTIGEMELLNYQESLHDISVEDCVKQGQLREKINNMYRQIEDDNELYKMYPAEDLRKKIDENRLKVRELEKQLDDLVTQNEIYCD